MPRDEGVKSPLMEEGMGLNLHADHAQTPRQFVHLQRTMSKGHLPVAAS